MTKLKLKAAARTAIQIVSIIFVALVLIWFEPFITAEVVGWILIISGFGFAFWITYMINLSHLEHEEHKIKDMETKQSKGDLK
jgi:hypothetical protein